MNSIDIKESESRSQITDPVERERLVRFFEVLIEADKKIKAKKKEETQKNKEKKIISTKKKK